METEGREVQIKLGFIIVLIEILKINSLNKYVSTTKGGLRIIHFYNMLVSVVPFQTQYSFPHVTMLFKYYNHFNLHFKRIVRGFNKKNVVISLIR